MLGTDTTYVDRSLCQVMRQCFFVDKSYVARKAFFLMGLPPVDMLKMNHIRWFIARWFIAHLF